MEELRYNWMDFHEILYLNIFWKFVEKIQVLFKSDSNARYFTWRHMYIYDTTLLNSYNENCLR